MDAKISFEIDAEDLTHVDKILDRAKALVVKFNRMSSLMDLVAVHANGCPMDFARLAAADDFNLLHDFIGIRRHIDRDTGELTGFFRPRFAKTVAALAA